MPSILADHLEKVPGIEFSMVISGWPGAENVMVQGLSTGTCASTKPRTSRLTTISCSTKAAAAMNTSGSL